MKLLSRYEEIILLTIWRLQHDAYGVAIREYVTEVTGENVSIGAIYAPLHRLEKKGYVKTHLSEPVPERGGRSKVYYQLTNLGKEALMQIKTINETLWVGLPNLGMA